MGRQIHFHMLPEDEEEFIKFVKTTGEIEILPPRSPTEKFAPFRELPPPFSRKLWVEWGKMYLLNRSIPHKFIVSYVDTQGCFTVDDDQSSVVQFTRSYLKGNGLNRAASGPNL